MDWLDGARFFFSSVTLQQSAADQYLQLAIQSALTMFAALLGAGAAEFFHMKRAKDAELEKRKLLATTSMHKVSMASSNLHSIMRAFFGNVPADTPSGDLWRYVLPAVPIQDSIGEFSPEEFTFLLPADGRTDVAYQCAELLQHAKICVAIINYYSIERRSLADMLDQHTVDFDTTAQAVEGALNLDDFPNIRRKMLETSLLCEQLKSNLVEAIQNSNTAIANLNQQIATLVGDATFNRRITVGNPVAR